MYSTIPEILFELQSYKNVGIRKQKNLHFKMPLKTPSTKQTFFYKALGRKEYKTSSNANTKKQLLGKAKLFRFIFHTNFSARKKTKEEN